MPGQAFDGSIWVTGGQAAALILGTAGATIAGTLVLKRAVARQGTLTQVAPQQRRRYKPVKMETQQQKEPRTGQGTVSAEDMEGMIVKIPDAGDKQTADR